MYFCNEEVLYFLKGMNEISKQYLGKLWLQRANYDIT
jgi:hypothetical protein